MSRTAVDPLLSLIERIAVHHDGRVRIQGEPWSASPPQGALAVDVLAGHLYDRAHAGGWPAEHAVHVGPAPTADIDYVQRLTSVQQHPRIDGGWQFHSTHTDGAGLFTKGHWVRSVAADALRHLAPSNDGRYWLSVPLPHAGPWGAFVFLYGATLGNATERGDLLRVYLHTRAPSAIEVLHPLMAEFDRQQIPFVLKTLMAPAQSDRTDATVVYVHRELHRPVLATIRRLGSLLDSLGTGTPLCALRLHPGVAVAEDTGTTESFGVHRMRLVAEGTLRAIGSGVDSNEERHQAVRAVFEHAGLRLDAPHRSANSKTDYLADWRVS